MSRVRVLEFCPMVALAVIGLMLSTPAASAAPVTIEYSGTADLSAVGLSADSTFSGFYTWESTAAPFDVDSGQAIYDVVAYSLIVNGVDMTGHGSQIIVVDDADVLETGTPVDGILLLAGVPVLGPGGTNILFIGGLAGPTSMFTSTALPANLDFLSQLETVLSLWVEEEDTPGESDAIVLGTGTLAVSAPTQVPEPTMWAMTVLGVAGVLARRRRSRND